MGYGKSRRDVMGITESYTKSKNVLSKDKIARGWWNSIKINNLIFYCHTAMFAWMQSMKQSLIAISHC